jgi:hypothetical protein
MWTRCEMYAASLYILGPTQMVLPFNPFRSYVGPRPTLWFSCSRRFSWYLTVSNPIFLPPAYSATLIYFGRERGWWITCNYLTVLKEKNINRNIKSTTCVICWLKSVLHEEKRREQENHNVGRGPTLWFSYSLFYLLHILNIPPNRFVFRVTETDPRSSLMMAGRLLPTHVGAS